MPLCRDPDPISVSDLKDWTLRAKPVRKVLDGRYCRLEPIDASKHGGELFEASSVSDAAERFRWLFEYPPESGGEFQAWLDKVELFLAMVGPDAGQVIGLQLETHRPLVELRLG